MRGKIDKQIVGACSTENKRASIARLAHTIARNKIQARWKNHTPPTQARKIYGAYQRASVARYHTEK